MTKTLFFVAVLLAPSLAYSANPSAHLSLQVVPAASVPAAAQAAGFTTLAANYDFSTPFYATQSNWLDCGNRGGPQIWHSGQPGIASVNPCNVFQGPDPVTGDTVLIFTYLPQYDHSGLANSQANAISMQTTGNSGGPGSTTFPNMYIEVVSRVDDLQSGGTFGSGNIEPVWTWQTAGGGIELDVAEGSTCCAGSFPGGGVMNGNAGNWANQAVAPGIVWSNYGSNNLPSGWDMTQYHKYAELLTSDGATGTYVCLYVDDILQTGQCYNMGVSGSVFLARNWLIMSMGNIDSQNTPGHTYHMYNKSVRVWSCAAWSTGMCNGSSLFNSGGLTYWH